LYNLKITNQQLQKLATQLGSDIPFFLHGKTAHVSGRGEIIESIKLELDYNILLVLPQTKVITDKAYKSLGILLTRNDNDFKFKGSNLLNLSVRNFKNIFFNEFENSIFDQYPNLYKIKNLLYREQAEYASLSGSGSAVYGIYSSPEVAQKAYEKLSKFYRCYVVKPVY
jgi:4-diphosphocytidyl-2-C-methyl-D-erythritol kinase